MGLLDIEDPADEFAFANFDSSFSPPAAMPTPEADKATDSYFPTAGYSLESVTTNSSTSTSSSSSSSSSSTKTSSSPSHSSSRRRSSGKSHKKTSTKAPRPKSFDLFGQDEELQSAEPRIGFCDICLKHCNIHDTKPT